MRAADVTRVDKWSERHEYYFDNGYGASVIRTMCSYGSSAGLWELAVLETAADGAWDAWALCYDTPITSDGIGYLSENEVDALLDRIEKLPKREVKEWTDS